MDISIIYALLSLCFAGINDIVFKKYSIKDRSRGIFIFGIGVTWTLLQLVAFEFIDISYGYDFVTLGFGLAAGIFLFLSNMMLLESLTHIDVGLGSTIYRLNTIGVVILSFLFLNESLGLYKNLGILCGIIAVLFLYQKKDDSCHNFNFFLFFNMAAMASLFRAMYGVTSKAGLLRNAEPQTMLLIISSCWILGGIGYALLREKHFRMTGKEIIYSISSGIFVFLIVTFLMLAIKYGQASIVIPIANTSFIVALLLSILLKWENLTCKKFFAIVLAVVSIVLLSKA